MPPTNKPRGRPRKPAGERSAADINIRTTKATKAWLKRAAKQRGKTLSSFILLAAMLEASNTPPSTP